MAGKDRAAAWIDGRIADAWPRPPTPGRMLAALAALLLLVDLALTPALRDREPELLLSATDARAVIAEAAADPGAWLMLGDSVLAGDVMAGRVADWQQHRVIDYLAVEQATAARGTRRRGRARFRQIALDGLLPTDILRIVAELDRHDPGGAVPVVVELNMRYFSKHYADVADCTRPWLCTLGGLDLKHDDITDLALSPIEWLAAELRPWVPILRHKRPLDLDHTLETAASELATVRRQPGKERRAAEGKARVAEHYRESDLGGESAQIRALDAVLERVRARGRRAVFFTTPLRDSFVAEVASEETYGGRYAALAERIHDSGARASLVPLDHPLFVEDLFLDHCHLGPAGNRLLALNQRLRLRVVLDAHARRRRIEQVDGLVGQLSTGDVSMRQPDRSRQRLVADRHAMSGLIGGPQPAQHHQRLRLGRLVDLDQLEAAGERRVLFEVLLIL